MSNSRPLPSSFDGDEDFYSENRLTKLRQRILSEPLIPLGCALTCIALYRASKSLKRGDKAQTNRYFRLRIYAQAFTVLAMVGGSYYYQSDREKQKALDEQEKLRLAEEKRRNWIRELEVRDREDREFREKAKEVAERKRLREEERRRGKGKEEVEDLGEGKVLKAVRELEKGKVREGEEEEKKK